jgi:methionine-gamma-lyase
MDLKNAKFATIAVHAGQHSDNETGALVSPMYLTSTFVWTPEKMARYQAGDKEGIFTYGRSRNPTQNFFQEKVAALEGGEAALATGSGMAAISLAILGLAHSGDHIISTKTVYGGTFGLFNSIFKDLNIDVTFVEEMNDENLNNALRPNTKLVYTESMLNPTLEILDLKNIVRWSQSKGLKTIVDNTFCTPFIFKPIEIGVDVVVHSTTKYINGHGDHVGGIIVGNANYIESIRSSVYQELGPVPSPFACWLGLRGLKTIHLRMREHCENAIKFAKFLENHPSIEKVVYPGLESHPQYGLAKSMFVNGFGGMVTFFVKGGKIEAQKVMGNLKMAYYAVSLGDLDTLIEHPATMTHGKIEAKQRVKMGIPDNMLRVSLGIEDIEDIIKDFDNALNSIR